MVSPEFKGHMQHYLALPFRRDAKACVLCYNISQAVPLRVVGILNLALVFVISRAFGNINKVSIEVKGGHRATKRQRLMPRLNWGDE
jgi:hypothetical protein